MGVWKSNCLRCNAEIPLPVGLATRGVDPRRIRQVRRVAILLGMMAVAGYASAHLPADVWDVPRQSSALLTALARTPYQRVRAVHARTGDGAAREAGQPIATGRAQVSVGGGR